MPLRLSVGGYAPRDSSHGVALDVLRRAIEEGTGGEVEVPVTWNILDQGRPASDLLGMVEAGEMFLCYFSTSYLGVRVPMLQVLETPYLFSGLEGAHRALDGALGVALSEAVRFRTGFEVLGYWDNGFRHFTNRIHPVHEPSDCAGMRVRLQPNPIHETLIRAWGATPVATDLAAGIDLIVGGEVDAQENPLANTVAYGVHRIHGHVTLTGHLYGARGLFVHAATFRRLPSELKQVVREGAREAIARQRRLAEREEERVRVEMESEGVEFVDPTADERDAFISASAPAIETARRFVGEQVFVLAGE